MPEPLRNPFAVPPRLRRLQIEITTGCNLRCAGCQRTLGMAAGTWRNAHMPLARFAAILANAPPADTIILQGIGEPTLHPDLPALVAAARADGRFGAISFNTNALVRAPEYYQALRTAGLNHVSVSVDSLDPTTAEAARAGTDTAQLAAAISALTGVFGGAVTLSIVLSKLNAAELPALLQQLHAMGGRMIEVQPLIAYGGTPPALCLTAPELAVAQRQIAAAQAALPGLRMMPAAALTPNGTRCRRPLHAGYVTVDGCLTPCCTTNDAALFGQANLATTDFATLWQGAGMAAWFNLYVEREPPICAGCAFNPAGLPPPAPEASEARLRAGALDAAEAGFRAVLADARQARALQGLGLVALQRQDAAGALPWLQTAFALAPDARSGHNLATTLAALGQSDAAIAIEQRVADAQPDYVPAQLTLAGMLRGRDDARAAGVLLRLCERTLAAQRFDLAAQCVAQLDTLPAEPNSRLRLANRLRGANRQDLALGLLQPLLRAAPDDIAARLVATMCLLAVVHADEDEIATRRTAYAQALDTLDALTAQAPPAMLAAAVAQVGNAKPFFLAYQGQDDRALQAIYGRVVGRIMGACIPPLPGQDQPPARHGRHVPATSGSPVVQPEDGSARPEAGPDAMLRIARHVRAAARGGRLRVGFASAYFHLHSVSKLFGGWLRHLDRERFALFGYQLGADADAMSASLAASCGEYRYGDASAAAWAARIAEDRLDALIYPEIGMHPLPVQLGCLRLAPLQCAAWGHPVTSGLPHIDCFLSSALMEPLDGDSHYTERVVRLPNLSIAYAKLPDDGAAMTRGALGLRDDAVVYVCCQSLFKYLPRHDAVFARIAAEVPAAQFLFIGGQTPASAVFRSRLAACFAAAGLQAERHVRIVPPVAAEAFFGLLRCADVYLDSIGWSGGNTTLEAIACGLPVVTLPTALMRGRHSAAILQQMGLADRVAADLDDYVAQAVALADADARGAAREAITARAGRLYNDLTPVRALEDWLLRCS
jgi:predicted O-linked N-acetylglucosamine transferase (SPINDLY family)